ncbi:hypothetical protein NLI96_g697 [Meripilus lineatus]|uniref:F-box domain-containing protein n=1 Tax=Meripilus lineatus TaxID=2056292 RepID=A0AAD5VDV0_9APHY|nr:hypothetical protein NLI96_g697 [Physisporinus lineatus]
MTDTTDSYSRNLVLGAQLKFLQEREIEIREELHQIILKQEDIQGEIANLMKPAVPDQVGRRVNASDGQIVQPIAEGSTIEIIPAELLLHIFGFYVCAYAPDAMSRDREQHPAVTISHVSRKWRILALNCSALWTTIVIGRKLRGLTNFSKRSGMRPLSIYHGDASPGIPYRAVQHLKLKDFFVMSCNRWRSLKWSSPMNPLVDILTHLNTQECFPYLCSLDLSLMHSERTIILQRSPMTFPVGPMVQFPELSDIRLSYVLPSELPPSALPALRTFHLHFPMRSCVQWPLLPKMSEVCAFLYRSPNLEELIFDDSVPLMDIQLSLDDSIHSLPPVAPNSRKTRFRITPIVMQKLTRFEWSFPPPKDAWRFFYFVEMPSLLRLDMVLNTPQTRLTQLFGGVLSLVDTAQRVSEDVTDPLIHFEALEDLRVETLDTDSLYQAFRKLDFPVLKKLSLSFIHSQKNSPKLPRIESIFREPRMPNLVSLTLRNFKLHLDETHMALRYMPALEHLTLDACSGANILDLLGNGGSKAQDTTTLRQWVCPRLEHLTFVNCRRVQFSTLAALVKMRKQCSARRVGSSSGAMEGRAVVPLRRRVLHQIQNRSLDASAQSTPIRGPAGFASSAGARSPLASPGRSVLQDWCPDEKTQPRAINMVDIIGCMRVSEAELISLQDDVYGVEEVYWCAA